MSYYDEYVQGISLRNLPQKLKRKYNNRLQPFRQRRIADLDENGR